jgi:hypothetical protein
VTLKGPVPGLLIVSELVLNGCIYKRLVGFGRIILYHDAGWWKLCLGEIVAYGGSGGAVGFLAGISRDWSAWSSGVGDVAGFGGLRFGGDVCADRERALHWYEARFGADGAEGFSEADVDCVCHGGVGVSGSGRIIAAEGAEFDWGVSDYLADRDVSGECESGAGRIAAAGKTGDGIVVAGADAGIVYWVGVVGKPGTPTPN